ncbi:MAG: hypothetical protein AB7E85_00805 [Pseudobdellovibrionaceae bacterium]
MIQAQGGEIIFYTDEETVEIRQNTRDITNKARAILNGKYDRQTYQAVYARDSHAVAEAVRFDVPLPANSPVCMTGKSPILLDPNEAEHYLVAVRTDADRWDVFEKIEYPEETLKQKFSLPKVQGNMRSNDLFTFLWAWENARELQMPQGHGHYSVAARRLGYVADEHGIYHSPDDALPDYGRFDQDQLTLRHEARLAMANAADIITFKPHPEWLLELGLRNSARAAFSGEHRTLRARYFEMSERVEKSGNGFLCGLDRYIEDPVYLSLIDKKLMDRAIRDGNRGQYCLPLQTMEKVAERCPQFGEIALQSLREYLNGPPRCCGGGHLQDLCNTTMDAAKNPFFAKAVDDRLCLRLIAAVTLEFPYLPSFAKKLHSIMKDPLPADDLVAYCEWKANPSADRPRIGGGIREIIS